MNKNNNFSSINSFFQFKNIFKYTLLITIFIFLSKLTALIRDLSFSFKFGSESEIEIFFLNFNLFSLFSGIFLNSLIFYLVPLIKPQKKIIDFYSLNIAFFLKLSIYFSLILFSIFFLIYNFEIIEISELVKKGANRNYFIFCLCFPIISLCFVFTAMMTSKNQHHCLIYDSIPNLALIISTLLFVYNEYLLSISFLIGVLIQFLILNIFNRYSIKKVFFYFFK